MYIIELYIMNFGQMYVVLSGIIKEPLYICQLRVIYACCIVICMYASYVQYR